MQWEACDWIGKWEAELRVADRELQGEIQGESEGGEMAVDMDQCGFK